MTSGTSWRFMFVCLINACMLFYLCIMLLCTVGKHDMPVHHEAIGTTSSSTCDTTCLALSHCDNVNQYLIHFTSRTHILLCSICSTVQWHILEEIAHRISCLVAVL